MPSIAGGHDRQTAIEHDGGEVRLPETRMKVTPQAIRNSLIHERAGSLPQRVDKHSRFPGLWTVGFDDVTERGVGWSRAFAEKIDVRGHGAGPVS